MSNLSMVEAKLPPGFRFHPRDEELICDYLMKKMTSSESSPFLIEVDLNKCEPWDIPVTACVGSKEWYFYSQRDRKYATGLRTNRATISGYWKATGKDRLIARRGTLIGMRKTLVFYQGRAPKGRKTEWVMHEFRLEGPLGPPKVPSSKEDWVLCRVFYKSKEDFAKQGMGDSSYDDTISSSSLPPLMDSYITFDQTLPNQSHHNHNHHDHDHTNPNPSTIAATNEQVPCFSNFTQNQISPTFSHITHMDPNMTTSKSADTTSTPNFGGLPQFVSSSSCLTPSFSSCDKKVLQAVLNHFTKLDNNNHNNINNMMMIKGSQGFGDGISTTSDQNFLSDVGLPDGIWNNHY